jgi:hypothetical protein
VCASAALPRCIIEIEPTVVSPPALRTGQKSRLSNIARKGSSTNCPYSDNGLLPPHIDYLASRGDSASTIAASKSKLCSVITLQTKFLNARKKSNRHVKLLVEGVMCAARHRELSDAVFDKLPRFLEHEKRRARRQERQWDGANPTGIRLLVQEDSMCSRRGDVENIKSFGSCTTWTIEPAAR